MAEYNENKLTKLSALKALAEKIKEDYAKQSDLTALSTKVEGLVTAGGEPNKIEKIKVNGTEQNITPTDKSVDIKVPVNISELTNDSKYQNETEVSTAIQTAISKTGHASFEKADEVPSAETAKDNILYLVMNKKTSHYDIYAKVGEEVVLLDDTTVDLTEYSKTVEINKLLENKVDKDGNKQLSTEDFTTDEKNKLSGIDEGANNYKHPVSAAGAKTSGLYKITTDGDGHITAAVEVEKTDITTLGIPEQDTTYTAATTEEDGLMSSADKTKLDSIDIATAEEVTAMLDEVFAVAE